MRQTGEGERVLRKLQRILIYESDRREKSSER